MTSFRSTPPEEKGWYWVETTGLAIDSERTVIRILELRQTHWSGEEVGSIYLNPDDSHRYSARIPFPQELEALEACAVELERLTEAAAAYMKYHAEKFYPKGSKPPTGVSTKIETAQTALDALREARGKP